MARCVGESAWPVRGLGEWFRSRQIARTRAQLVLKLGTIVRSSRQDGLAGMARRRILLWHDRTTSPSPKIRNLRTPGSSRNPWIRGNYYRGTFCMLCSISVSEAIFRCDSALCGLDAEAHEVCRGGGRDNNNSLFLARCVGGERLAGPRFWSVGRSACRPSMGTKGPSRCQVKSLCSEFEEVGLDGSARR